MSITLADLIGDVSRLINDPSAMFWTPAEITDALVEGYLGMCRRVHALWDWTYLENRPRGFSYTAAFEADLVTWDYGRANYTADFERRMFQPEYEAEGFGNHTMSEEWQDGRLAASGGSMAIPALAELPSTLTEIDRVLWDQRGIAVLTPREAQREDARYETTTGEVYGLMTWEQGLRTVRKVRVPAAAAATYTIRGAWGILRGPADFSAGAATGTWGIVRRVPGHHPIGHESFGLARRPYRDGTNVRVEQWREGRTVSAPSDRFELPDRATVAIRDYALWACYAREGPAQDTRLATHYRQRYERGVARITRRTERQTARRVVQFGGQAPARRGAPPRPRLPWTFGTVVQ